MSAFFLFVNLFYLAFASDAPAKASALMQARLRGTKTTVASPEEPQEEAGELHSRELITGQRYSDDDESCDAEGITPGVCALASLARPPPAPAAVEKHADCDKQESADRLERALIAEIDAGLAGNHTGFDGSRIASLELELQPIFQTLPHEAGNGLGFASARYLLHQHFLRQHAWYVRGLNPAGDGRQPPSEKEGLRSRVAGHLLEVLENKVGKQGLSLKMLAVFVATLEHLLHGDQRERLKQAWAVHALKPDESTDKNTLTSVLEVFMAHYVYVSQKAESGYALGLEDALQEVKAISRIYGGWPQMDSFIREEVLKRNQITGSKLTFDDAADAADAVLLLFQEVSGSMCRDMEKTFMGLTGGETGRVRLTELRSADGGDLFRESVSYLRELGALDESNLDDPYVFMTNYMYGPSNCDGTTSFYDLCCPNDCEVNKGRMEKALAAAPADPVAVVVKVAEELLAGSLSADGHEGLTQLVQANGGQVLIHGRGFANWLHQTFPRECPKPREADFKGMAGDVVPDANTDFQATASMGLLDQW